MTKYIVKTEELHWVNVTYSVSATSEEEAKMLIESGQDGEIIDETFDCIDQLSVISVEEDND